MRTMITRLWIGCCLALVWIGCAGPTPTPPAEPIRIRLATVSHLIQLAQELSGAFSGRYPYVTFELSVMPPQEAIAAVSGREIDVALVAEPLGSDHQNLEATEIGREAVVLAVHPANPVEALTWDQVRGIFSGQMWDWAAVDSRWQPQEILVVSQHAGSISRLVFERQVMDDLKVTPRAVVATGDELAGQFIADEPAAIGYLSAGAVDDAVKVLRVEGVAPSLTGIAVSDWPITRPVNLVTHVDANVYVLDFVDFSREGSE